ncbi:mannosyl-oligosaccharide glucosidase [Yamadazyma tenuis ATCC 10573]|uniref:Mannosyl-oligosaccharide glucosidase n=1 Tax=Candida tenuis (strain ATCC 10573 / BCRC 21748 / CBS 615 / JCM 9827 / NBRC 10315 / NRRL Y-1498 / VKM Y-70) TaxID=590646 RepID=G3B4L2_CANTC|nr:mannosyl-oligosaccharide glucosidase [Yamadazyma tenuis ATCC 10573]EGV63974.1 mannosyl-oligosaccharide glucosidase [Yamadazyma tenuis ATCC 10573]
MTYFGLYMEEFYGFTKGKYKAASDSSLLWGPYRSGLYFGIRPRIPRSLLSGLMWFNMDDYNGVRKMRHFYEQNDPMKKANWIYYDPRYGGRQVIIDKESHIKLVIDFIKSEDGKSWGVKVKSKPQKGFEHVKTSFVWYSGMESEPLETDIFGQETTAAVINLDMDRSIDGRYNGPIKLAGASEDLGFFTLSIGEGPTSNQRPKSIFDYEEIDPRQNRHLSLRVPNDEIWRAKDIFNSLLQDSVQDLMDKYGEEPIPPHQSFVMRDMNKFQGNLHFVQQIFEGEAEFYILYDNAFTPEDQKITKDNFEFKSKKVLDIFHSKFKQHFELLPPFDKQEYQPFAKEIVSGLLGGISYFYGDHLVDRETKFDDESFEKYELEGKLEGPHELFTLVPSRPFFPRGFLWDEGFHLLPLLDYDSDLALEIIQSWFSLIDDDGWIAREQILGPESRSRVPEDFRTQSPEIVNPPTLMLVFTFLLRNLQNEQFGNINAPKVVEDYGEIPLFDSSDLGKLVLSHPELLTNYTKSIYPHLKAHYEMFRRTQKGYLEDFGRSPDLEVYRWRGRTLTHCLASGLDDYPRALPADIAELNVDLLSWIGVMTRSVKLIANILGEDDDVKHYQEIENNIIKSLDDIHWSEEEGVYCDKSVDEDEIDVFVCYKGYVSLFPFITKMMGHDSYDKLERLVDFISDPEQLWSDYGIRSVSKSDPTYRTGENYWRSPIWVNINYLVLDALKHYKEVGSGMPKPLQQKISSTYHDLRVNLVDNTFKEWKRTGFLWEQYDDETGVAKGAKNFLGWTSTVILMMSMPENI